MLRENIVDRGHCVWRPVQAAAQRRDIGSILVESRQEASQRRGRKRFQRSPVSRSHLLQEAGVDLLFVVQLFGDREDRLAEKEGFTEELVSRRTDQRGAAGEIVDERPLVNRVEREPPRARLLTIAVTSSRCSRPSASGSRLGGLRPMRWACLRMRCAANSGISSRRSRSGGSRSGKTLSR